MITIKRDSANGTYYCHARHNAIVGPLGRIVENKPRDLDAEAHQRLFARPEPDPPPDPWAGRIPNYTANCDF